MNIQEFLARKNIPFDLLEHADTYDAQHMAQAIHVSGHHVAKTVLLRTDVDELFAIAVLPATHAVDFDKAAQALSVDHVSLASEKEVAERCPDCEVGALPPFGSQYNMKTILDQSLVSDDEIVFEGTNHHESIRMKRDDFEALERPIVCSFSA